MGLFGNLFSRRTGTSKEKPLSFEDARNIVADFGGTLEGVGVGPTQVADSALLPHAKERIDAAYQVLFATGVPEEWRDAVATSFMALAWFQPGVGAAPQGLNISPSDLATLSAEELARLAIAQIGAGSTVVNAASAEFHRRTEEVSRLGW